jgi:outer membrane protein OmpA-like peptidoglycan-associated protein
MANEPSATGAPSARKPAVRTSGVAWSTLCLLGVAVLTSSFVHAQPMPDTQRIIEALTPAPSPSKPTTRSVRNLVVRDRSAAAPARAAAGAQASIDLTIEFDFGSAAVREQSRPLLDRLAEALQSPALQRSQFLIEGHTDAIGSADRNLKLSEERAEEVKRILVVSGVMPSRVTTAGRGATQPANAADPNASENRRVRIVNVQ